MIPEAGNYFLCLAAGIAVVLSGWPFWDRRAQQPGAVASARILTALMTLLILLAFASLIYALIENDFTVRYVAENSNSQLPVYYRIAAAWGGHEGSLLLWNLLLTGWTSAVALSSRHLPPMDASRMLAIMAMINAGFLLFIVLTSNPFLRTLPDFPVEGRELNPLLQDPGLIVHPPLIYMGYVGFAVPFAFAIASLLGEVQSSQWVRWVRPWVLAAWSFLTIGIVLGSAWAYYELGWGGWWFWDPVENASLMPWLAGTALLHSLSVTEKRGIFQAWSVLLAIAAFTLSLLGTFLVRSGVLISVHAFASDPSRGLAILIFMSTVVGSSLLLFALRGQRLIRQGRFSLWSRETFLASNNLLLTTALSVVMLGTLVPLVHKVLGLGSISVGAPFFNLMFTVLVVPLGVLLGAGPLVRWGRDKKAKPWPLFAAVLLISVTVGILLPWVWQKKIVLLSVMGIAISVWILLLTGVALWRDIGGAGHLTLSTAGMYLGHAGVAIVILGIAVSQNYSIERDVRMMTGDHVVVGRFDFYMEHTSTEEGANYEAENVHIIVSQRGKHRAELNAQKRFYYNSRKVLTEAAIARGFSYDLYAALGEKLSDGSWTLRLHYKPLQHWIWGGGFMIALAGVLCFLDPRYRNKYGIQEGKQSEA
ncbi:heme lyase CcmF/NrfE family subunit [Scandinavium sp. NPDC088450]|uniref:heme lyase CcmF/NrfE family subunit n=1 Tax=Scandinavium sp. NPDC088450 TaxID=3364514 RepID=UPI00384B4089